MNIATSEGTPIMRPAPRPTTPDLPATVAIIDEANALTDELASETEVETPSLRDQIKEVERQAAEAELAAVCSVIVDRLEIALRCFISAANVKQMVADKMAGRTKDKYWGWAEVARNAADEVVIDLKHDLAMCLIDAK